MPQKTTGPRVVVQTLKDLASGLGDTPTRPADATPTVPAAAPTDLVNQGVEAVNALKKKRPQLPDPESWK